MMTRPNHLFLSWQCPESRKIMPVGRLLSLGDDSYEFSYIRAAEKAEQIGFGPLVSFPDFGLAYRRPKAIWAAPIRQPARRTDFLAVLSLCAFSRACAGCASP